MLVKVRTRGRPSPLNMRKVIMVDKESQVVDSSLSDCSDIAESCGSSSNDSCCCAKNQKENDCPDMDKQPILFLQAQRKQNGVLVDGKLKIIIEDDGTKMETPESTGESPVSLVDENGTVITKNFKYVTENEYLSEYRKGATCQFPEKKILNWKSTLMNCSVRSFKVCDCKDTSSNTAQSISTKKQKTSINDNNQISTTTKFVEHPVLNELLKNDIALDSKKDMLISSAKYEPPFVDSIITNKETDQTDSIIGRGTNINNDDRSNDNDDRSDVNDHNENNNNNTISSNASYNTQNNNGDNSTDKIRCSVESNSGAIDTFPEEAMLTDNDYMVELLTHRGLYLSSKCACPADNCQCSNCLIHRTEFEIDKYVEQSGVPLTHFGDDGSVLNTMIEDCTNNCQCTPEDCQCMDCSVHSIEIINFDRLLLYGILNTPLRRKSVIRYKSKLIPSKYWWDFFKLQIPLMTEGQLESLNIITWFENICSTYKDELANSSSTRSNSVNSLVNTYF